MESDGCHLIKLGGIAAPAPLSLEDADYFDYSAGLVNRLPECEYFRVSSKAIDNSIEDECFQEHFGIHDTTPPHAKRPPESSGGGNALKMRAGEEV